jgi:hypothetical protein
MRKCLPSFSQVSEVHSQIGYDDSRDGKRGLKGAQERRKGFLQVDL